MNTNKEHRENSHDLFNSTDEDPQTRLTSVQLSVKHTHIYTVWPGAHTNKHTQTSVMLRYVPAPLGSICHAGGGEETRKGVYVAGSWTPLSSLACVSGFSGFMNSDKHTTRLKYTVKNKGSLLASMVR